MTPLKRPKASDVRREKNRALAAVAQAIESFMECDVCRAKTGAPILCDGCFHNRTLINNLLAAQETERERHAKAAMKAKLPKGYQWGHDAMEQFNFGKKRAADAIRSLKPRRSK